MIYNVYLICAEFENQQLYKIGFTKRDINKRIKELKTGNPAEFYIVDSFSSKWGTKIESLLHKKYRSKKINREWFKLDEKDISEFKGQCELIHKNLNLVSQNMYYKDRILK